MLMLFEDDDHRKVTLQQRPEGPDSTLSKASPTNSLYMEVDFTLLRAVPDVSMITSYLLFPN